MGDIKNDIVKYIDKRELDIDHFKQIQWNDIVDDFIHNFDTLNLKYSHCIQVVDVESINLDGCFDTYLKNVFKYSMHLFFTYNNHSGISVVELKIRRLCNIYVSDSTNIVICLNKDSLLQYCTRLYSCKL